MKSTVDWAPMVEQAVSVWDRNRVRAAGGTVLQWQLASVSYALWVIQYSHEMK